MTGISSPDMGMPVEQPANSPAVEPNPIAAGETPPANSKNESPAFDPYETIPETPMDPEFARELEDARSKLRTESSGNPEENLQDVLAQLASEPYQPPNENPITDEQPTQTSRTVLQKIGHVLSETKDQAQLTSIMIAQLGGIHPARVDGGWHWVAGKWAKIEYDSKQWESAGADTDYYHRMFQKLKDQGIKIIGKADLPNGDIPDLRPLGLTGLQYLDHNRIKAALDLGLEIRVEFSHYDTYN